MASQNWVSKKRFLLPTLCYINVYFYLFGILNARKINNIENFYLELLRWDPNNAILS